MRQQLNPQPESEASLTSAPALDSTDALLIQRKQLKHEIGVLKNQLDELDAEIRPMLLDGEKFSDGQYELYLLPVETTTFDWKTAIAAGVITQEQAAAYLKRTISTQIRSRKVEKAEEQSPQDDELRERLSRSLKGA